MLGAPQPTYADLPALVAEARGAGLHVEFEDRVDADGDPVPDAVGRTVYRIVQEGITNAAQARPGRRADRPGQRVARRRHRRACCATRSASARPHARAPGSGLVGLTERAELRGGRLEHGAGRARRSCCAAGYRGRHEPTRRSRPHRRRRPAGALGAGADARAAQTDLEVVGEAGDGREGVALARPSCGPTWC